MSEHSPAIVAPPLELLPYQTRIVEFLKRHDPDVWNWFASTRNRAGQAEELKFDLLKSTYRIDRDSQPELYEMADRVAGALGLSAPITIYQSQDPTGLNASLAYLPGEAHVVLHGPLTTQLTPVELAGLLGHELTHLLLWQLHSGDLFVAAEMLAALTNDSHAHPAHFASWRLLKLYNEIVCDRGALLVTQEVRAVVSMLVKVQTGVTEINPDSYLKQADEIFARGKTKAEGITHPEAFIRARAIKLWAENDPQANAAIAEMIEAGTDLKELDLLGQQAVASWTRRIVDLLLSHKWFQTDPVLAHARLYFEDYAPPTDALTDPNLSGDMRLETQSHRDYVCLCY
jgi:Zn-dependent protease with chaperone function